MTKVYKNINGKVLSDTNFTSDVDLGGIPILHRTLLITIGGKSYNNDSCNLLYLHSPMVDSL